MLIKIITLIVASALAIRSIRCFVRGRFSDMIHYIIAVFMICVLCDKIF